MFSLSTMEIKMGRPATEPCITNEGVTFTVVAGSGGRTCLITHDALYYLCSRHGHTTDVSSAFNAFEKKIRRVARQLPDKSQTGDAFILDSELFREN
jgi:hypothetical protein